MASRAKSYIQADGKRVTITSRGVARRYLSDGKKDPEQIAILERPKKESKDPPRDFISHQGTHGANRCAKPGQGCLPTWDRGLLCGECRFFTLAKGNAYEGYCSLWTERMRHLMRKGKAPLQSLIPVSAVAGPDFQAKPQAA